MAMLICLCGALHLRRLVAARSHWPTGADAVAPGNRLLCGIVYFGLVTLLTMVGSETQLLLKAQHAFPT